MYCLDFQICVVHRTGWGNCVNNELFTLDESIIDCVFVCTYTGGTESVQHTKWITLNVWTCVYFSQINFIKSNECTWNDDDDERAYDSIESFKWLMQQLVEWWFVCVSSTGTNCDCIANKNEFIRELIHTQTHTTVSNVYETISIVTHWLSFGNREAFNVKVNMWFKTNAILMIVISLFIVCPCEIIIIYVCRTNIFIQSFLFCSCFFFLVGNVMRFTQW